jgi:hypothetical protein
LVSFPADELPFFLILRAGLPARMAGADTVPEITSFFAGQGGLPFLSGDRQPLGERNARVLRMSKATLYFGT